MAVDNNSSRALCCIAQFGSKRSYYPVIYLQSGCLRYVASMRLRGRTCLRKPLCGSIFFIKPQRPGSALSRIPQGKNSSALGPRSYALKSPEKITAPCTLTNIRYALGATPLVRTILYYTLLKRYWGGRMATCGSGSAPASSAADMNSPSGSWMPCGLPGLWSRSASSTNSRMHSLPDSVWK